MATDKFSGHLDLLILTSLRRGAAHGYRIGEHLRVLSDQYLDYPEGTIYPALHKLEGKGLISSSWSTGSGRKRRMYKITKTGIRALQQETDSWQRYVAVVTSVLEC